MDSFTVITVATLYDSLAKQSIFSLRIRGAAVKRPEFDFDYLLEPENLEKIRDEIKWDFDSTKGAWEGCISVNETSRYYISFAGCLQGMGRGIIKVLYTKSRQYPWSECKRYHRAHETASGREKSSTDFNTCFEWFPLVKLLFHIFRIAYEKTRKYTLFWPKLLFILTNPKAWWD